MKLISHRGNIVGPEREFENQPGFIERAVKKGYDVEVDVWYVDGKFMLGHDKPEHEIGSYWLYHPKLWRHAKNLEALRRMLTIGVHCFWHQNDDRTLTNHGYVWTYPGKEVDKRSVLVVQGPVVEPLPKVFAVCSDYVDLIKIPKP